jgi:hypothetical protein
LFKKIARVVLAGDMVVKTSVRRRARDEIANRDPETAVTKREALLKEASRPGGTLQIAAGIKENESKLQHDPTMILIPIGINIIVGSCCCLHLPRHERKRVSKQTSA